MTTPVRINLLPHREQKRIARQRQFVSMTVLLVVMALGVVGLVHFVLSTQIENQNSRNALLKSEIAKLDEQIREIDKLRDQIAQVLSRKQVVETLQSNRNEAVHLLDQLVRQLPDGIYLKSIKQSGAKVTVVGYAQSNARVSTLMRNIDSSPWLASPELVEVKLVPVPAAPAETRRAPQAAADRVNEFTLNLQLKRTAPPPDPRLQAASTAKPPTPGAAPPKPATPGGPAAAVPTKADSSGKDGRA